jgi:hypothetical protein
MTNLLKVTAFVSFKDQILRVEQLGGMDNNFIFFNPDEKTGRPDWKIQLVEKVFLRIENSDTMLTLDELESEFVIINSSGDEIGNSNDLNPEFVMIMVERLWREVLEESEDLC